MESHRSQASFDRLSEFRAALNIQAKLYCNIDNAYSMEKAEDYLNQLAKAWKMDIDSVITVMVKETRDLVDKRFRMYVLQFLDMMKIPHSEGQIKERWANLSIAEKNEVIDGVIDYMQRNK